MRTRSELVVGALGLRVTLKARTRLWARCPFHDPKGEGDGRGSFFVRTEGEYAGRYHCYKCKAKGNLVSLAMGVRDLSVAKAREFVADVVKGWKPPPARMIVVEPKLRADRRRFELPREVRALPLAEWDTLPRRYAEERGVAPDEVDAHGAGYAVEGRLAGRIVFPVRDGSGKIVSYTARTFVDDEPRYLTPHESELPDLGAVFGEHLWPPPGERRVVVATEGALDALAAGRATGLPYGALGGSDVRSGHLVALSTFALVVVLTDDDAPGRKAAAALRAGLGRATLKARPTLPRGLDAAALALRDPERLRLAIERAITRARENG